MATRIVVLCVMASLTLAASAGDPNPSKLTPEEQRIFELTNEVRKKEGLEPLRVQNVLVDVGRKHSQTMAKLRKLEHEIDGVGPGERLKKAGYKFFGYGENILYCRRTGVEAAEFAMKQWLKSEKHRENILNKDFKEVGIGVATNDEGEVYFTQVFGKPRQ